MNNKIAINTYQQLIKKQNKQTDEKQNHRYGFIWMVTTWEGKMGAKVQGISSTNW